MADNTFNDFDYQPKFGGGNDIYLKFNNWDLKEESVKIRIASPTYTRLQVRKDDQILDTKTWDISDMKLAIEDQDYNITQKFSWVVLVKEDGKDTIAKVYEAGAGVFKKIASINADPDWNPVTNVDLKIIRKGVRKDARYDVVPSPNNLGPVSDEEFAIADQIHITKYLPDAMTLQHFDEIFGK